MRSRSDDAALARERVLRVIGLLSLVALGVRLAVARPQTSGPTRMTSNDLQEALPRATQHDVSAIELEASRALDPVERDWLSALRRAGSPISWTQPEPITPLAVEVEPVIAPGGRVAVDVRASPAAPVAIRDDVGLLDSLAAGRTGALSLDAAVDGRVSVNSNASTASVVARDSLELRTVLVVGPAGWETKYVLAALEEAGWRVAARITVSPNVTIGTGAAVSLDTARVAAVVVLDSSAMRVSEVARFVNSGGGAVLAVGAASQGAFASLAGVAPAQQVRGELGALTSPDPRRGLSALTFRVRDQRSTVLERREGAPIAVARRAGAGRVLVLGAEETWRWRMQGGDGSVAAHRAWWSTAVSRVAYAPLPNASAVGDGMDAAPLAAMHAALGPPTSPRSVAASRWTSFLDILILGIALISLVAEWTSRRLRGAR